MFDSISKLKGAGQAERPLALVAFGKHPGWNDFIRPSIGQETETLSYVRHSWYEVGLKGLVDSGVVRKLEGEKRLEGFDHVLVWLRPGHVIFGQLWSSSDGIGRKEYPMVLCVDGEGMPLAPVLARATPELDRLREVCKQTSSAEQVQAACRTAQERLQTATGDPAQAAAKWTLPQSAREKFLDHPSLGPDRAGLLRVLHQINSGVVASAGGGTRAGAKSIRPSHLRLPLAGDSTHEAVLLWAAFLQTAISASAPALFLLRNGEQWFDVIIGEPLSDDLICLQASRKAMPLTTDIPYEISSETRQWMESLGSEFLTGSFSAITGQRGQAVPSAAKSAQPRAGGGGAKWWSIGLVVLIVAALGIGWLVSRGSRPAPASVPPAQAQAPGNSQERYELAVRDAQAAFEQKNFAGALTQAETALQIKHGDPAAMDLKNKAGQQLAMAGQASEKEHKYQEAIASAKAAMTQQNYAEASSQAQAALQITPNDAAATELKNRASQQLALASQAKDKEHKYQEAMANAKAAMTQQNYAEASSQAQVALQITPNDAAATELKNRASQQLALASQAKDKEHKYQEAMANAKAAMTQQNYAEASSQAQVALQITPNDAAATELKNRASQQLALASQAKDKEHKYQEAMANAKAAMTQQNYAEASSQAQVALQITPNDAAATELKNRASQQLALASQAKDKEHKYQVAMANAKAAMTQQNYAEASSQAQAALQITPNDAAATDLKNRASQQLALASQAKDKEHKYQVAMANAKAAMTQQNYAEASSQAQVALQITPNDAAATDLKNRASQQLALAAQPKPPSAVVTQASIKSSSPATSTTQASAILSGPKFFTNAMGMEFVRLRSSTGGAMWVGKYEVTQQQYRQLMASLPDGQEGTNDFLPVANVQFKDAQEFCRRMGEKYGKEYVLPTKTEWLDAAGLPVQSLDEAWKALLAKGVLEHEVTSANLDQKLNAPQRVGSLGPQPNQICDMFGNVREWVRGDDGGKEEIAGFAYTSSFFDSEKLFQSPSDDNNWLIPTTGFRCFIVQDK